MLKELGWCSGSSSVGRIQSALWESDCWRSPKRYHLRSKAGGVLGGSILLRTSAEGILYPTLIMSFLWCKLQGNRHGSLGKEMDAETYKDQSKKDIFHSNSCIVIDH